MPRRAAAKTRAERFKANLRALIAGSGLTQKAFADKLNLPYNWLRRSCNDGIARLHPNNEANLKLICDFFDLGHAELLWGSRFDAKRMRSFHDLADENKEFVGDLKYLLTIFPNDQNVSEVKRAITEAVKSLDGTTPAPKLDTHQLPRRTPKQDASLSRSEQFKKNLRTLIEISGMTQKAFAEQAGVPYNWMQKSCTDGISRLNTENNGHVKSIGYLKLICMFFGLAKIEILWGNCLDAIRIRSKNSVSEEHQMFVFDIIWLLTEFPGDPVVGNVKRVIAAVTKHLYVPKEKPVPAPKRRFNLDTDQKDTFKMMDELFGYRGNHVPTDERATTIESQVTPEVDDGSDSVTQRQNSEGDFSRVSQHHQKTGEFIAELPQSLRQALTEDELKAIISKGMFERIPPETLRQLLDEIKVERDLVVESERTQRRKRIRR